MSREELQRKLDGNAIQQLIRFACREKDRADPATARKLEKVLRSVHVDGFRPGNAPFAMKVAAIRQQARARPLPAATLRALCGVWLETHPSAPAVRALVAECGDTSAGTEDLDRRLAQLQSDHPEWTEDDLLISAVAASLFAAKTRGPDPVTSNKALEQPTLGLPETNNVIPPTAATGEPPMIGTADSPSPENRATSLDRLVSAVEALPPDDPAWNDLPRVLERLGELHDRWKVTAAAVRHARAEFERVREAWASELRFLKLVMEPGAWIASAPERACGLLAELDSLLGRQATLRNHPGDETIDEEERRFTELRKIRAEIRRLVGLLAAPAPQGREVASPPPPKESTAPESPSDSQPSLGSQASPKAEPGPSEAGVSEEEPAEPDVAVPPRAGEEPEPAVSVTAPAETPAATEAAPPPETLAATPAAEAACNSRYVVVPSGAAAPAPRPAEPAPAKVETEKAGRPSAVPSRPGPRETTPSTIPVTDLAASALRGDETALAALPLALVRDGEPALAFQLAQAAPRTVIDEETAARLRILALAPGVRSDGDRCALDLAQTLERLEGASPPVEAGARLLELAGLLRPALLAQGTGAMGHLQPLDLREFPALGNLVRAILDFGALRLELTPALLKGVREHAAWQQAIQALQAECRTWLERGRCQTILYAAATQVWHRWLEPTGVLYRLLEPVWENRDAERAKVLELLEQLLDRREVDRLITATDRELRGKAAARSPINSRAHKALESHLGDALDLARRWADLHGTNPRSLDDFRYKQAGQCRDRVLEHLARAHEELAGAAGDDGLRFAAGTAAARATLQDLHRLFDPAARSDEPLSHELQLGAPLLRFPALELTEELVPRGPTDRVLHDLLRGLTEPPAGPQEIFEAHVRAENHLATDRLLELWTARSPGNLDLVALAQRRAQALADARAHLEAEIERTHTEIERAVALDLLSEEARLSHVGVIESIRPAEALDIRAKLRELEKIRGELAAGLDERLAETRTRLDNSGIEATRPDHYRRIAQAIENREPITANEYIDLSLAGQQLPAQETRERTAIPFFPEFVRQLGAYVETAGEYGMRRLAEGIASGHSIGPVDMSGVPGAQAKRSAELLEAWTSLKRTRGNGLEKKLARVVGGLGFDFKALSAREVSTRNDGPAWFDLDVAPVSDRASCVIPAYGSLAHGRYGLYCVWHRPAEDELLAAVSTRAASGPVIVFHFGRMSEQRRRDLARLCRERRRSFIVIDDALVYYLCMQRGAKLPVLFQAALPFTVAQPYLETASLVPPEMFFGRTREREAIFDRFGANLVYGGRQLGKTALLRDVERRFHDPEGGTVVRWIDLKEAGVGMAGPADSIWPLVVGELAREGIVPRRNLSPEPLRKHLRDWLDADQGRRIVLLLDEADSFLYSDSKTEPQPYANLLKLKGLMEETDRRFKVVFAGLHDVQRTARDVNTPLAHLGTPLCIGPLLENGEWQEARALVELPLRTLGYRFESVDLPMRILSHTNYYPSLLQLFCKRLLDHLTNTKVTPFDSRTSPPYVITSRHVEDAYQSRELRKAIRDRFQWTLNLDPRYRLLALCIALGSYEDRSVALVDGFTVAHVREQALRWWPAGFSEDRSIDAFRTILDEMIGLGLLRRTPKGYALRSANVVNLLGREREIEDELLLASDQEPPLAYDPGSFRRVETGNPQKRSPLTASQEALLLAREKGVAAVFGTRAAGLDDVIPFLRAACEEGQCFCPEPVADWKELQPSIEGFLRKRKDGVAAVVVGPDSPWGERWIVEARRILKARSSKTALIRVIFVGDATTAWAWVRSARDRAHELETVALHPWSDDAVRRWLIDAAFGPTDRAGRKRIAERLGNWGHFLHVFGKRCEDRPFTWSEELERVDEYLPAAERLALFDLPPDTVGVLRAMAIVDAPVGKADLATLAGADPSLVDDVLTWADLLGLASCDEGLWSLDGLLGRALREA